MIEYVIEGRIAVIIGCSDDEEELFIPDNINGNPVGKIQAHSFVEKPKLRKVVFPKTVKLIGEYAFASCKKLREVVFTEGLETIEDWAFISCNIETVELPKSLKMVGENAFLGNVAKADINDFIEKKDIITRTKVVRPKNAAIFPIGLIDNLEAISRDVIIDRATYYETQIDSVKNNELDTTSLDLPFVFDGNEVLVGIALNDAYENLSIEISKETKRILGKYDDGDPDFLVLRLEVVSDGISVGEIVFKSPYLEKIDVQILEEYRFDDNKLVFFKILCRLDAFGSGNISREFAINIFRDLDGKYFTQYKNHLISKDVYNEVRDSIEAIALDTLKSFIKQVSYAPILTYIISVFEALMSDGEYIGLENIQRYIGNRLYVIYDSLGTYESFENVCFDISDATRFIEEVIQMSYGDIRQRYGLYIQDDEGAELDDSDIEYFKGLFKDSEVNYDLYAEFLEYIYNVMDKLNQEFAMRTYQE